MNLRPEIVQALSTRDDSVDAILPECALPDPLPSNVQGLPAQILSADEIAITECDPAVLVEKLQSREWSCETVVQAFLRRAALAQKTVSFVYPGAANSIQWYHTSCCEVVNSFNIRPTVSRSFSGKRPLPELSILIHCRSQLAPFMACQSRSKNNSVFLVRSTTMALWPVVVVSKVLLAAYMTLLRDVVPSSLREQPSRSQ